MIPMLYFAFYNNEFRDRIVLISVCSLMFLLLALRKPFSDVLNFGSIYNSLKEVSFSELIKDFHILGIGSLSVYEWGFSFLCWIFVHMYIPYQVFIVVESAFCIVCLYFFIEKNSINLPLSIALIIGFGLFDYMYIIVRQTIALGFLFLAVEPMKKRNLPVFLLLVLLSTFLHRTSLIFLLAYPLSYIPINKKSIVIFCGISLSLFAVYPFALKYIIGPLFAFMSRRGYAKGAGTFKFKETLVGMIVIALFLAFFSDTKKIEDKTKEQSLFWVFMLCIPVSVLGSYIEILTRLSTLTLLPFAAICIPNLCETNENKKLVRIIEILIYLAAVAYYAFCLFYDKRELEIIPYKMFFMN